ncbi:MAG: hypothetical protein KDA41_02325, partial [Planctomycetales bacterium]|nr:hypothetical protein [Planctomycetales bacterium]
MTISSLFGPNFAHLFAGIVTVPPAPAMPRPLADLIQVAQSVAVGASTAEGQLPRLSGEATAIAGT